MENQTAWRVILTLEEARQYLPDISDTTVFPIVALLIAERDALIMDRTMFLGIMQSYISQLILFHDVVTSQNTIVTPQEEPNE